MSATAQEAQVAFCLLDSNGEVLASRKADREFYAASTIKLGVLVAVLRRVDEGSLALDSTMTSRHVFPSRIEGAGDFAMVPSEIDRGMPAAGEPVTIAEALRRMVVVSSNEATNMLVELVGLEEVNVVFERLGTPSTLMTRMIGDYAAREAGFTHTTTAADLARIMYLVVSGQAAGVASTELMVQLLSAQEYPVIAEALSENDAWGSKSGWVDFIHHDVAFIRKPGQTLRFLGVCTSGLWVEQAQESIRAVTAQLS